MNKEIEILGIMTGTSADGVDLSSIKFSPENEICEIKNLFVPFSTKISIEIKQQFGNKNYTENYENFITNLYIDAIEKFISYHNCNFEYICVHGQTIYHNEQERISIQVINHTKIANYFNKKVIYDFRKNDLLNGGNGAPIVPIFHKKIFPNNSMVVNIGGVSNITYLNNETIIASDVGIGNALMDDYIKHINHKEKFDKNGDMAKNGNFNVEIFNSLIKNNFFKKKFPKSIDRDLFKQNFNEKIYQNISPNDVLNTLCNFTVFGIKSALEKLNNTPQNIIICGGGAKNKYLVKLISNEFENHSKISLASEHGYDVDFIESQAFSYLGLLKILKKPATFPSTTGVKKPTILGKIISPK